MLSSAAGVTVAPRLAGVSLQSSSERTSSPGTLLHCMAETCPRGGRREPVVFQRPLARFVGLPEGLQHRLAGAGPKGRSWCAGKEGARATCPQRAEMGVSVWMASTYHGRVRASFVLLSWSG